MKTIGYARVSTDGQSLQSQKRTLALRLIRERASGFGDAQGFGFVHHGPPPFAPAYAPDLGGTLMVSRRLSNDPVSDPL